MSMTNGGRKPSLDDEGDYSSDDGSYYSEGDEHDDGDFSVDSKGRPYSDTGSVHQEQQRQQSRPKDDDVSVDSQGRPYSPQNPDEEGSFDDDGSYSVDSKGNRLPPRDDYDDGDFSVDSRGNPLPPHDDGDFSVDSKGNPLPPHDDYDDDGDFSVDSKGNRLPPRDDDDGSYSVDSKGNRLPPHDDYDDGEFSVDSKGNPLPPHDGYGDGSFSVDSKGNRLPPPDEEDYSVDSKGNRLPPHDDYGDDDYSVDSKGNRLPPRDEDDDGSYSVDSKGNRLPPRDDDDDDGDYSVDSKGNRLPPRDDYDDGSYSVDSQGRPLSPRRDDEGSYSVDSKGNPLPPDDDGSYSVDSQGNPLSPRRDDDASYSVDSKGNPLPPHDDASYSVDSKGNPLPPHDDASCSVDSKGNPLPPHDDYGDGSYSVDSQGNPLSPRRDDEGSFSQHDGDDHDLPRRDDEGSSSRQGDDHSSVDSRQRPYGDEESPRDGSGSLGQGEVPQQAQPFSFGGDPFADGGAESFFSSSQQKTQDQKFNFENNTSFFSGNGSQKIQSGMETTVFESSFTSGMASQHKGIESNFFDEPMQQSAARSFFDDVDPPRNGDGNASVVSGSSRSVSKRSNRGGFSPNGSMASVSKRSNRGGFSPNSSIASVSKRSNRGGFSPNSSVANSVSSRRSARSFQGSKKQSDNFFGTNDSPDESPFIDDEEESVFSGKPQNSLAGKSGPSMFEDNSSQQEEPNFFDEQQSQKSFLKTDNFGGAAFENTFDKSGGGGGFGGTFFEQGFDLEPAPTKEGTGGFFDDNASFLSGSGSQKLGVSNASYVSGQGSRSSTGSASYVSGQASRASGGNSSYKSGQGSKSSRGSHGSKGSKATGSKGSLRNGQRSFFEGNTSFFDGDKESKHDEHGESFFDDGATFPNDYPPGTQREQSHHSASDGDSQDRSDDYSDEDEFDQDKDPKSGYGFNGTSARVTPMNNDSKTSSFTGSFPSFAHDSEVELSTNQFGASKTPSKGQEQGFDDGEQDEAPVDERKMSSLGGKLANDSSTSECESFADENSAASEGKSISVEDLEQSSRGEKRSVSSRQQEPKQKPPPQQPTDSTAEVSSESESSEHTRSHSGRDQSFYSSAGKSFADDDEEGHSEEDEGASNQHSQRSRSHYDSQSERNNSLRTNSMSESDTINDSLKSPLRNFQDSQQDDGSPSQDDSFEDSLVSKGTFMSSNERKLTKITEHSVEMSGGEDQSVLNKSVESFVSGSEQSPASFANGTPQTTSKPPAPLNSKMVNVVSPIDENVNPAAGKQGKKASNFSGYTREQMSKLTSSQHQRQGGEAQSVTSRTSKPGKRKRHKINVKSEALLGLVANVNEAMLDLEDEQKNGEWQDDKEPEDNAARRLLHGFEALVGILLQLSDELELLSTFARRKDVAAIEALQTLLSFAPWLDDLFAELKPILQTYLEEEIDEEMNDFLYGMNLTVDLLCELTHRVGEKQSWNPRANTSYVTLLELLSRDTLEVTAIYDDIDTPEHEISELLEDAWDATGHIEEFKTLQVTEDITRFRQICYEVMLSTDQWCPDINTLMDICGIDASMLDEHSVKPNPEEDDLAPAPETAVQILERISGQPLPRTSVMSSILRRILPTHALTDTSLLDNFVSIRNTIRNPLGLSISNMVAISSVPENLDDPDALGVAGVGKTTLAAMVATHDDIRRFFRDGVAWIYIGQKELNYTRYVQCLRDLVAQLDIEENEEPLFPELLHTPGESSAKRRRREEGFMIYVREVMAEFLQYMNVLIILDDVCFEPDLDWFDFGPPPVPTNPNDEEFSCIVLVTTRCRNLLPAADTVEVDMLEEGEAVQLLIQESGELSHSLVAESPETRSVVMECANHPLAVKSVGRWLNLKHATAGVVSSVEEIHEDVVKSMDKILKSGNQDDADMMYEILNMSLSPAINGEPTNIIKFCFAAFVLVFCERKYISDFALADSTPIIPLSIAELLFESLLDLEEETLLKEGSLFYAQKKEAAVLIPEALSALGVLKVIITFNDTDEGSASQEEEEKYLQVMHIIQQEYGEYLVEEDESLIELRKDAEVRWNQTFAQAYLKLDVEWDTEMPDAGLDYALEMMPIHMIRGGMLNEAASLLSNESFVRGRLFALGRENATRRHIKDCESLFDRLADQKSTGRKKADPKAVMKQAYQTLGGLLNMDEDEYIAEEGSAEAIEVGRAQFEIGFSLAEKRCWEAAILHWEASQELLVSALGMVEVVAGLLFNVGVVYAEMNEYEQALGSLKQCLRIRGAIHGEEHILYAQTIQKIGDIFLGMSDYHEAMESYNWALDVMHIEPSHHRIDIGDISENMGSIHYSKGETEESLQCYQEALRSKQVDLGEDHPELASLYHHIGNCLSDQGKTEEAIAHFEEAIRLKQLDPDGGPERDADVLTIEGVLHNLNGRQADGLACYEKALQILVTRVPHKKEKVASLLHLIGCVYLMSGEHKKAMKLFEESLQARRKVLGFVHLDVASTLFNMAFLHQTRNRLDKALKCLEEALKIRQLRLPDSEKVAVTHEKIGTLARSIGKTKKAEIQFAEALRIRKLLHGESHEAVATVLQELGDLKDDLGEYDEAMKYYGEALNIRHNRLGPDDLAVAETLYSMGFTLQNSGAAERALQCFEESLSIRTFQLGEDAKEVGDTLNMMGFLQAKRGELDDALSLLWDALRIRKLQEDHVKVSETLKNIGNVHREKEEFELAVECYEECLRIRRAELGNDHEKVADALIALGNVQSDMEQAAEAMISYKEALSIRMNVFGENDESVAAVLQYMGTLEFGSGELQRALMLLSEFTRIRQDNGTPHDGDYVNVLFMIGNIHKMQGNKEEAQRCWKEAYEVFQELGLAAENPQIAEVMNSLVVKDGGQPQNNNSQQQNSDDNDADNRDDMMMMQIPQTKGVFGRLTEKVKGTLPEASKLASIGRPGRGKNRGHQL